MPTLTSKGQLCFNRSRNLFGLYGASPEFRLHVTIADASEKIRFGFGRVLGDAGQDERVSVENLSSRRVVQGVATASGDVLVSR